MAEPRICRVDECEKPATLALVVRRPNPERLYAVLDFDDQNAPRGSTPYCTAHGTRVILELITTLT